MKDGMEHDNEWLGRWTDATCFISQLHGEKNYAAEIQRPELTT